MSTLEHLSKLRDNGQLRCCVVFDIDLSPSTAPDEVAQLIAAIRNTGWPNLAQHIEDGIRAECKRLGLKRG